jgi:hypothetical protein
MELQSESLAELAPALVAAQGELENVVATFVVKTEQFDYKYADLADVRKIVAPIFAKHGLAVTQTFVSRPEALIAERVVYQRQREVRTSLYVLGLLRTTLLHASGQWIASEIPIAGDWGDTQRLGSAITYLRRYSLSAIAGIAQVDDDAATAAPPIGRVERPGRPLPYRQDLPQPNARQPGDDFDEFDDGIDPHHGEVDEIRHPGPITPQPRPAAPPANGGGPPFAPSQRTQTPAPASASAASHGRVPNFGKGGFYGWAKDHDLVQWFQDLAGNSGLPKSFREWTREQVAWAYGQYENAVAAQNDHTAANGNGRH